MLDDEFKTYGRETNKAISEFQQFDAVEYYIPKENATSSNETVDVPESSVDSSNLNLSEQNDSNNQDDNSFDRSDKFNNKADGEKSPDINAQNETAGNVDGSLSSNAASDSSVAAAEEAGASAASTVGATCNSSCCCCCSCCGCWW